VIKQAVPENLQWTKRLNQERVDSIYFKHFGEKYTDYRILWNKADKDSLSDFPIHLDFELVDECNLRCRHCYRNEEIASGMKLNVNTGEHLSFEVFEKAMSEGKKYGLKAVNLGFSGECLLNRELIKMIYAAKEYNVLDIRLITNATLMTEEMADKLLESPLTFLSFSVDAGKQETYAQLKGKDFFNKLHDIMRYVHRRKLALKKDFPLIRASFYASPENKKEKNLFLKKFQPYVDFIDFQRFHDLRQSSKHYSDAFCRAPFQRMAIFANGDISPCCTFFSKKLVIGNIAKETIREIWHSKAVNEIREGLRLKKPVSVCRECLSEAD